MSQIRILPEIISNKIAAGEVVERPASVVKELVENALDAGSTKIVVEAEKGGRSLIRISDNGSGMNRDDALLALERYATSKIFTDADLYSIRSLGFRGEALPSIAAVSRFTLVTRESDAAVGTEIRVAGGKILKVTDTGAPPGTMVTVESLFFNTPARRKFMKTVTTEMGHIADVANSIALGRPEVYFRLMHNGKVLKSWPPAADRLDRVAEVLGTDLRADLFPVGRQADAVSVDGWVSSPQVFRSTSRGVFLYVNGRFVRDRVIQHGLFTGYRQRLVKGRFPLAALFVTLPSGEVDINVHPTKHEVRFAQQRLVHDLVQAAVAETLDREDRPKWGGADFTPSERSREIRRVSENLGTGYEAKSTKGTAQGSKLKAESTNGTAEREKGKGQRGIGDIYGRDAGRLPADNYQLPGRKRKSARHKPDDEREPWKYVPGTGGKPQIFGADIRFSDLRIIGQLRNAYIVCETGGGMLLLDQHAAHERVLYEQLKKRSQALKKEAQRLLVPETIELGFREAGILEELLGEFKTLGLEIDPFGTNTFLVRAVPAILTGRAIEPLIREIVEKLAADGFSRGLAPSIDVCLKLMACHGSIRARQALDDRQIRRLLQQLDACDNPSHCPHGRPTWLQWTSREIEKAFSRIV
jgi:DNA mismatch repair protein MutL